MHRHTCGAATEARARFLAAPPGVLSFSGTISCILLLILQRNDMVQILHMAEVSRRPNFYRYMRWPTSLDDQLHEQVKGRLARRRTDILDERNVQSYRHGSRWALEASIAGASEMRSMAAESTMHTIDIINHETTTIESYIDTMVDQLYSSMMTHLFQTVEEGAEAVGNKVSRNEHGGDISVGYLAMLEKIEFGVDRHGRATRPTMYVAPSTGKDLLEALQSQPSEFHLKVEMLMMEKEKKAVALEAERISKFRWRRP